MYSHYITSEKCQVQVKDDKIIQNFSHLIIYFNLALSPKFREYLPFKAFDIFRKTRMADFLSEELLIQYRKAFSVYGKDDEGKISPKDLGIVMRSLGYNPTESELQVL